MGSQSEPSLPTGACISDGVIRELQEREFIFIYERSERMYCFLCAIWENFRLLFYMVEQKVDNRNHKKKDNRNHRKKDHRNHRKKDHKNHRKKDHRNHRKKNLRRATGGSVEGNFFVQKYCLPEEEILPHVRVAWIGSQLQDLLHSFPN